MQILLVEDDDHVRWVIEEMLAKMGHQFASLNSANSALEHLKSAAKIFYDCLILDRNMPGITGIDLLRILRKTPDHAHLPVIMLTGNNTSEAVAEGLASGAQLYLAKPASYDILKAALNSIREQSVQREELRNALNTTRLGLQMAESLRFQFKTPSQANQLAALLANLADDADEALIGLSELLMNAVEHGNLEIGYNEKSRLLEQERLQTEIIRRLSDPVLGARVAHVHVDKIQGRFRLTIEDQGHGFDWKPYLEFSQERAFDLHGRGIAMANHSGLKDLKYLGRGNLVEVWLDCPLDSALAPNTELSHSTQCGLETSHA